MNSEVKYYVQLNNSFYNEWIHFENEEGLVSFSNFHQAKAVADALMRSAIMVKDVRVMKIQCVWKHS